jgi:predicted transglutaminase-like cysteine proteinase
MQKRMKALILASIVLVSILLGFTILESDVINSIIDTDGDKVTDDKDAFPNDPAASLDSDGDGYPDRWNPGKGQSDSTSDPPLELDDLPFDPDEHKDSDNDGVGDNSDVFPDDPNEWSDLDSDGVGDNSDINPTVNLSIDLKLEKFKVTSRVDILRWAQIYFEVKIDNENIRIDNNGRRWWVWIKNEKTISHDLISYDIPDDTTEKSTEIEIIMYDYDPIINDDIVDISAESGNSLHIIFDHAANTVSKNEMSQGSQGKLWFDITLNEAESPDQKTYTRIYNWRFKNKNWKITYEIPINTYMNYLNSNVNRIPQNQPNSKDKMAAFVTSNEKVVKDLADELLSDAENKNYNDVTTANFILKFVQTSITYRLDDETKNCQEYWRFPVETLVDIQGDCEDTSVLYAAIMDALNYDVALLFYSWVEDGEKVGHLAVGIQLEGSHGSYVEDNDGTRYYYCETTTTTYSIGQIPKDIKSEPKMIIPI